MGWVSPPPPTPSAAELCLCKSLQRDAQQPPILCLGRARLAVCSAVLQGGEPQHRPKVLPQSYCIAAQGQNGSPAGSVSPRACAAEVLGGAGPHPAGLGFACRSLSCVRSCWTIYNLSVSTGNAERKSRMIGRETEVPLANSPLICKHIRKKPEVSASFMDPASHGDRHLKTETGGSRFHSCLLG